MFSLIGKPYLLEWDYGVSRRPMLTTGVVECRPLIREALEALLMTNVDQSRNLAKSVTVE
jgi:hypothetical protein